MLGFWEGLGKSSLFPAFTLPHYKRLLRIKKKISGQQMEFLATITMSTPIFFVY